MELNPLKYIIILSAFAITPVNLKVNHCFSVNLILLSVQQENNVFFIFFFIGHLYILSGKMSAGWRRIE